MANGHGGRRPNSGRRKGFKFPSTLSKEQAREALRAIVIREMDSMVRAQIDNAQGVRHTFLRNEQGRFVLLTDPKQIEDALNSGEEGNVYWTYTKDPSIRAFTDLMNRALGKPTEAVEANQQGEIKIQWMRDDEE